MGSNVRDVWGELTRAGLTDVQAAGLIGRWQQESGAGLNPTAYGDKSIPGGSQGIGQWNRERLDALQAFGGTNWRDPSVQARFALHELDTTEKSAGNALKNAKTYQDAVNAAMAYERPLGWTPNNPALGHGYKNTLKNAMNLLGMDFGTPAMVGPPAQQGMTTPSGMPGMTINSAPTVGLDPGSMWHDTGMMTGPAISAPSVSPVAFSGPTTMPGLSLGSWRGAGSTPGGVNNSKSGGGIGGFLGGLFGGMDKDKDKGGLWGGAATRAERAGYI